MDRDASVRLIMRVTHIDFDSFTVVSNQKVSWVTASVTSKYGSNYVFVDY